ncbi:MAG: hypothetical protein IRZ03_18585 [Acidobacterium ailaaui]|nr:hypothetical protein [Pseudacidobacterium ailaaui]
METTQSSLPGKWPIQPLKQDDQGKITGGFSAVLEIPIKSFAKDEDSVKNKNGCVVNNCQSNCVAGGCAAK